MDQKNPNLKSEMQKKNIRNVEMSGRKHNEYYSRNQDGQEFSEQTSETEKISPRINR